MKLEAAVFTGIGTPQIIIQGEGIGQEVVRFSIPKEITGDVAIECLRYAFHNDQLSEDQKNLLIEFSDTIIHWRTTS